MKTGKLKEVKPGVFIQVQSVSELDQADRYTHDLLVNKLKEIFRERAGHGYSPQGLADLAHMAIDTLQEIYRQWGIAGLMNEVTRSSTPQRVEPDTDKWVTVLEKARCIWCKGTGYDSTGLPGCGNCKGTGLVD